MVGPAAPRRARYRIASDSTRDRLRPTSSHRPARRWSPSDCMDQARAPEWRGWPREQGSCRTRLRLREPSRTSEVRARFDRHVGGGGGTRCRSTFRLRRPRMQTVFSRASDSSRLLGRQQLSDASAAHTEPFRRERTVSFGTSPERNLPTLRSEPASFALGSIDTSAEEAARVVDPLFGCAGRGCKLSFREHRIVLAYLVGNNYRMPPRRIPNHFGASVPFPSGRARKEICLLCRQQLCDAPRTTYGARRTDMLLTASACRACCARRFHSYHRVPPSARGLS